MRTFLGATAKFKPFENNKFSSKARIFEDKLRIVYCVTSPENTVFLDEETKSVSPKKQFPDVLRILFFFEKCPES